MILKKFANNLRLLKNEFAYPGFSFVKYFRLSAIEDTFINFIGCCSAVNQERDYLSKKRYYNWLQNFIKAFKY